MPALESLVQDIAAQADKVRKIKALKKEAPEQVSKEDVSAEGNVGIYSPPPGKVLSRPSTLQFSSRVMKAHHLVLFLSSFANAVPLPYMRLLGMGSPAPMYM